jgi:DNA-binding CsgD family transcriptional regulator
MPSERPIQVYVTERFLCSGEIVGAEEPDVDHQSTSGELLPMSERELEVLAAMARGLSSKQCALELGIAPRTVERHVENLRNKLNARNKPHLVAKALSGGLI